MTYCKRKTNLALIRRPAVGQPAHIRYQVWADLLYMNGVHPVEWCDHKWYLWASPSMHDRLRFKWPEETPDSIEHLPNGRHGHRRDGSDGPGVLYHCLLGDFDWPHVEIQHPRSPEHPEGYRELLRWPRPFVPILLKELPPDQYIIAPWTDVPDGGWEAVNVIRRGSDAQ